MGFDNLITIGIIIYIIYSIKKTFSADQKDKKKDGKTVPRKTGWAGKLGDFINEVKEEIEKANREALAKQEAEKAANTGFDWDDLQVEKGDERTTDSRTISQTLFYEPAIPPKPPSTVDEIPEIPEPAEEEESHRNYHGTHDKPMPEHCRRRRQSRCFSYKKTELKKAVIWSEILSKPVGLRD